MGATFVHNEHGLLRSEDGERFESWRGGHRNGIGRSATPEDFSAALRNSHNYGPSQQATIGRWYAEWYMAQEAVTPQHTQGR